MLRNCKLSECVICKEDDPVLEVAKILRDTGARHIFVVNENEKPLGVISTVDINNRVVAEEKNPMKMKAKDIMTAPVSAVDCDDPVEKAFLVMTEKGTYSCPVTQKGKIIGMVTYADAAQNLVAKGKKLPGVK